MKNKLVTIFVLSLLIFPVSLTAHEIRPAYLQIIEIADHQYEIFWKVPSMGDAVPRIQPVFPKSFSIEILKNPNQIPGSVIYYYGLSGNESIRGHELYIQGLNKTLIDVLVNIKYLNGETATFMLQADKDSQLIPGETSSLDVIKTYTVLGVEHILLGIDHLLFVLALILITKGRWKIVKTITAFTIAHSITLSLAALGYVNFPGAPVEAVIALSIVFLAVELINNLNGRQTLTSKKPWIVAFSFGLLHGFGFAGALADIGLPQQDIPLALAFFNVGVEIGQLLFVLVILVCLKLLSLYKKWPSYVAKIPAYAIGSIAAFWMIERVVAFWKIP
ncbi:HupE/UreJ family protein [Lutimonas sp.]|uniref:HupE/UreJ family protein n=1 Tax=Lutimonas sp. TaxID=1872403 RepID=UPI003D9B03AC